MTKPADDAAHLLIVDDDDRLRALLGRFLREHGFAVTLASSAADARKALGVFTFDAMILDVLMPGETGLEFARSLGTPRPPVLMLSALGEVEDRVAGLEAGVDDYIGKPFEPKELLLRVQAVLRRAAPADDTPQAVHFGDYIFHLAERRLTRGEETIHLTAAELTLLMTLAEHAGNAVSREALAEALHIKNDGGRSVDVQITRLRRKIEPDGKPTWIQTVRGEGYALAGRRA